MQATPVTSARIATPADAAFLARMDYEASLPPFGVSFWNPPLEPTGTPVVAFLERMFLEDASNWGAIDDFIILEVDGKAAATCAVFRPPNDTALEGPLNLDKLGKVASGLGWTEDQRSAFLAGYQKDWSGDTSFMKPQAELIVETVAVAPEYRGHGLGDALMQAAFDRARALGAASLGVMVIHGNDAARALYEKHFEPYVTFHAAYFDNEFPGMTKFRAKLSR